MRGPTSSLSRRVARHLLLVAVLIAGTNVFASSAAFAVPGSVAFAYTGATQSWQVPAGVTAVDVELLGAQGEGAFGGLGARVRATIPVTAGSTLQIRVGGAGRNNVGGFNGGASGGYAGTAGGGASDVRNGAFALNDRLVVAAGGGGSKSVDPALGKVGGSGGGLVGEAAAGDPCAGGGGTQTQGGAGGDANASPGAFGAGGGAVGWAGGGGGGWYGGGGGSPDCSTGGGGGSSHTIATATNVQMLQGWQLGDGAVRIQWPPSSWTETPPAEQPHEFSTVGTPGIYRAVGSTVDVDLYGGEGDGWFSGLGGRVSARLNVTVGQPLLISVGGMGAGAAGGWNGGGNGGGSWHHGGGGGATDVRIGGWRLEDRVVVAAGGGGASANNGPNFGAGGSGGTTGEDGDPGRGPAHCSAGGGGATATAGGASGGDSATVGKLGIGGSSGWQGGGGGGGWYGGGAGASDAAYCNLNGGGGGGSDYAVAAATNVQHWKGFRLTDGFARMDSGATDAAVIAPATQPTRFDPTGAPDLFVVRPGVGALNAQVAGASGEWGFGATQGGRGGFASATLMYPVGTPLTVVVGSGAQYGFGGYNGGGDSRFYGPTPGGGGGGATDIRVGGRVLADRVLVGGGGGGASADSQYGRGTGGGGGGGTTGFAGGAGVSGPGTTCSWPGGGAGTQTGAGDAGAPYGSAGDHARGGDAGLDAGAGGGGWFGGGGGGLTNCPDYPKVSGASGGGGGSGHAGAGAQNAQLVNGSNGSAGWAQIVAAPPPFGNDPYGEIVAHVHVGSGNVVWNSTDANVEAVGPDLNVARFYNSLDTRNGLFGVGWSSNLDVRVDRDASGNTTIIYGDGRRELHALLPDGSFTSPPGFPTTLTSIAGGGLQLALKDKTATFVFDNTGRLQSIADRYGHLQQLTYDANGLTTIADAASGRALHVTVVGGNITSIATDAVSGAALRWNYGYDSVNHLLTSVCDARNPDLVSGSCTRLTYTNQLLTKVTKPAGNDDLRVQYRTDGKADWTENGAGNRTGFTYNDGNTIVRDPRAIDTTYAFDSDFRTVSITDALGGVTKYDYDASGYRSKVTDANNNVHSFTYDALGNPLTETDGENHTTYKTFDLNNLLIANRDARSSGPTDNRYLTTYGYNAEGDEISETAPPTTEYPSGVTQTKTYTNGGENFGFGAVPKGLLRTSNPGRGANTQYEYDAQGNLRKRIEATGLVTTFTYDALGRTSTEVSTWAGGSATTTRTWTPLSLPDTVTRPAVAASGGAPASQLRLTFRYDANANLDQQTATDLVSSQQRITEVDYDTADRPIRRIDAENQTTAMEYDGDSNVVHVTDPLLRSFRSTYDQRNLLTQVKLENFVDDPLTGSTPRALVLQTFDYDAAGRKTDERVPAPGTGGRAGQLPPATTPMVRRHFDYFNDDRLKQTTLMGFRDRNGTTRDIVLENNVYDNVGDVLTQTTGGGLRVVTNTYDELSRLQQSTLALGSGLPSRVTGYDYLQTGQPTRQTTTEGASTSEQRWVFDPNAPLATQSIVENGATDLVTTYGYDQRALRTSVTDPRGGAANVTTSSYDQVGNVTAVTEGDAPIENVGGQAVAGRPVTTYGYNAFGERTDVTDARANHTRSYYDRDGRLRQTDHPTYTPPAGGPAINANEQWVYDAVGNLQRNIDRRGQTTVYDHDGLNRVVRQTDPKVNDQAASGTVLFTYDDAGNKASRTDQTGALTTFTYDDLGRTRTKTNVVRQNAPAGSFTTTYDYDDLSRQTFVQDPTNVVQRQSFDAASQLRSATNSRGGVTLFEYDAAGRRTRATDPLGRRTDTIYDLAGRPVQTDYRSNTGALLASEYASFDAAGNQTARRSARSTSASDNTYLTTYVYNSRNQLTEVDAPNTPNPIQTTYGYDATGNTTRVTNGAQAMTTYTYTPWNTPESTVEPSTPGQTALTDRTFTVSYDAGGLPLKDQKPGGVAVTRTFDELGRLRTEAGAGGGATAATKTFNYDRAGRRTVFNSPGGNVTLGYDDRGLELTTSNPGATSVAASSTYDAAGRMTTRKDGAGTSNYTYDATTGDLKTVKDPLTGKTSTLAYETSGQVRQIDYGTTSSAPRRTFAYDTRGFLQTDTLAVSGVTKASATYGYYADGTIQSQNLNLPGNPLNGMNTYDYDRSGRVSSWTPPGAAANAYTYDGAGNRLTAGAKTFTYDARNRITGGSNGSYTWSPRGTLVSGRSSTGVAIAFTYDALDRQTAAGSTAYAYDGLGRLMTQGSAALTYIGTELDPGKRATEKYARLPDGSVFASSVGGNRFANLNQHGDVSYLFDTSGTLTATDAYDPFGVATKTGTQSVLGYQADVSDATTGQVDMGARWYDPGTGQFGARDTEFGMLRTPVSLNRYTYALNNPLSYFDPDGRGCEATSLSSWGECARDLGEAVVGAIQNGASAAGNAVYQNVLLPIGRGFESLAQAAYQPVRASLHTIATGAKTAVRALGNAASACWNSSTCRTVVVGVAVVGLGIATGGLGDVALGATMGSGFGLFHCHGDVACIANDAIAFGAAGLATPALGSVFGAQGLGLFAAGEGGIARAALTGGFGNAFFTLAQQAQTDHFDFGQILVAGAVGALFGGGTRAGRGMFSPKTANIVDDAGAELTQAERAATKAESFAPSSVRLSQSSVNGVSEIADSMSANGWVGDPIDAVRMPDGGVTAVDNSRVIAAHEAGIDVQANVHAFDAPLPEEYIGRFTTPKGGVPSTWGEAIMNRIGAQNSIYRNTYPFGSPFTGWNGS